MRNFKLVILVLFSLTIFTTIFYIFYISYENKKIPNVTLPDSYYPAHPPENVYSDYTPNYDEPADGSIYSGNLKKKKYNPNEKPSEKTKGGTTFKNKLPEISEEELKKKIEPFLSIKHPSEMIVFTMQMNNPGYVIDEWILNYILEGATEFVIVHDHSSNKKSTYDPHPRIKRLLSTLNIKLTQINLSDILNVKPVKKKDDPFIFDKEWRANKCRAYFNTHGQKRMANCQNWVAYYVQDHFGKPGAFYCFNDVDEYIIMMQQRNELDVKAALKHTKGDKLYYHTPEQRKIIPETNYNLNSYMTDRSQYSIFWIQGVLYGDNNLKMSDRSTSILNSYPIHSKELLYHNNHYALKSCYKLDIPIWSHIHAAETKKDKEKHTLLLQTNSPFYHFARPFMAHLKLLNIDQKYHGTTEVNKNRMKHVRENHSHCTCLKHYHRAKEIARFFSLKEEVSYPENMKVCDWCHHYFELNRKLGVVGATTMQYYKDNKIISKVIK